MRALLKLTAAAVVFCGGPCFRRSCHHVGRGHRIQRRFAHGNRMEHRFESILYAVRPAPLWEHIEPERYLYLGVSHVERRLQLYDRGRRLAAEYQDGQFRPVL